MPCPRLLTIRADYLWAAPSCRSYYDESAPDGLFLGLGDFIVFSVFSGHTVLHIGLPPLGAVATGLLAGLVLLMTHVALKWPLRALEPAIPLSVVCAALLLFAERFAIHPLGSVLAGTATSSQ